MSDTLNSAEELVGHQVTRLEDIVDREALGEVCRNVHELFGIAVRVYTSAGVLLASAAGELPSCAHVNEHAEGRAACAATVTAARSLDVGHGGGGTHACFSGLAYEMVPLEHEGVLAGRIVLGPYAPASLRSPPPSVTAMVPRVSLPVFGELLARAPRVKPEALARIARHLRTTLELIIFSSHKAWVTSKMHLFSVRDGYAALEAKTQKLESTLRRLEELDRLKSSILATVSHELRTPLTSILGYSEMLSEGIAGPLGPEQAEFVRTIHDKGEQLLRLILGLLDLSKLESGTMPLRPTEVHAEPLLRDVVTTVLPTAKKKEVGLELVTDAAAHPLSADAERLRQVFLNLVENAVKFTPRGGRVVVRARAVALASEGEPEDGLALLAPLRTGVEIAVEDTGIGIARAERAKVFDAFYQVDSSSTREYGGTGLGLSIVKRIVEAHAGRVVIESNEPQGTRFVVTLPSARAARALPSHVPAAPLLAADPTAPTEPGSRRGHTP